MEFSHVPVLLEECMQGLNLKSGGIYVDCTLGGAGHSSEILKRAPKGRLQFEIGVQTTNQDTMNSIERNISFEKIKNNVLKLLKLKNMEE